LMISFYNSPLRWCGIGIVLRIAIKALL